MTIKVTIGQKDYVEVLEAAKNRKCNSKTGNWGGGFVKYPSLTGCLGEKALSIYTGLPVDFSFKERGDEGDLICPYKLELKTATRNYGELLVRAIDKDGNKKDLNADYYIAAYIEKIYGIERSKVVEVILVGWCSREYLVNKPLVPARRKSLLHKNKVVPYTELLHLELLKSKLIK